MLLSFLDFRLTVVVNDVLGCMHASRIHFPFLCPWQSMSVVLNVSNFPFVIDVACWATKREYLKLDKWVTDKVKEHHVSTVFSSFTPYYGGIL